MAVKRITIDMDAYERLSRLKRKGQSFSQVIRELTPPAVSTGGDLLEVLDAIDISETTLDALDQIVEDRLPLPPKTLYSGLPHPRPQGRPPA
ncbi:MAG: antitoxin VapB family protein [Trueperaceae bacterium]|nr:antitoxin VapB family protein [Trueperaceae bacterium]